MAGQPLARLRTETIQIEVNAARAELTLRAEELAELKNGSRPEEIDEARARVRGANAVAANTAGKLERAESLFRRSALNQEEFDDIREQATAAEQLLKMSEAVLKRIEVGPRPETIAQAEARYLLQQEQVRLLEDRLEKYVITAPFDGFVAAERTQVGEWIQQGDPVAEIIQLDEVKVEANIPADQAVRLSVDAVVRVEFPELPEELFTGVMDRVVPNANPSTRTFPTIVRLTNRLVGGRPVLMAGMLARLEIPTGEREPLLLVPKDAIVFNGPRRSVFVLESASDTADSGTVRSVPVILGVAEGSQIEVESAGPGVLAAGTWVVVEGNERLVDRQPVSILRRSTVEQHLP